MEVILSIFKGKLTLEYLDDTFMFLKFFDGQLDYVLTFMDLSPRASILLEVKEWFFF